MCYSSPVVVTVFSWDCNKPSPFRWSSSETGSLVGDVPNPVHSIPYYWELSLKRLEEYLDKIKKHNDNSF